MQGQEIECIELTFLRVEHDEPLSYPKVLAIIIGVRMRLGATTVAGSLRRAKGRLVLASE